MQLRGTFEGTDRYVIEQPLGAGGFGIVYQAFDRVRGEQVALKLLRHLDAGRLYAFKREFRALADVAHKNLVALYELASERDDWFFTMELIEGRSFLDYLRHNAPRDPEREQVDTVVVGQSDESDERAPISALPLYEEARLRDAFAQLVEGVQALHHSDQLHRDLKPSNALVTASGRVVLLDFGLVMDIGPEGSVDEQIVGSVPYMSPEQGFAERLTPASDFYAIGAMLYEALTGRLPHTGKLYELLVAKRQHDPLPPAEVAGAPSDLSALAMDLLARDPERRPDAEEVLRRLGNDAAVPIVSGRSEPSALVGRHEELSRLESAFADAQDKPVAVFLHGGSGMGKTALIAELARRLRAERDAVVLRGSCYERESVPYKALDSLMDAVSSHLRKLDRLEAERLMPREVKALARLFPVLERVESIADFPPRAGELADLEALRRRAIAAFRELLSRMRDRHPLCLCIDDVQWGDVDSVRLLRDLLNEDCPPMLLLFCYRSEDRQEGPFVDDLHSELQRQRHVSLRELEIGPLGHIDALDLARALLGDAHPDTRDRIAQAIARESRGNPFFIHQLTSYFATQPTAPSSSGAAISLADALRHRLEALDDKTRALIEVVAVAGRPVAEPIATVAAGLREARPEVLALRHAQLIRTSWQAASTRLSVYHDRIREAVIDALDRGRIAELHLRLATTLERSADADAEAIAEHYRRGGAPERAAAHAERAADDAFDKLAFERAARLYDQALELASLPRVDRARLYERLARALAFAGRGPEAARAYLAAIEGADARRAVDLRCRAAEQYFFSGHIDQGTDLFHQVLKATGLPPLPRSEAAALVSFLRRRLELRLRGLAFTLETDVEPEALVRTDVCYSIAAVLGGIRPLAASSLQTHHLLLALRAGEPYRVVRGLGLEAIFTAMAGPSGAPRMRELLRRAGEIAAGLEEPRAQGFATAVDGIAAYFVGDWRRAREALSEAETILAERCPELSFELGQVRCFLSLTMFYMGAFAEGGARVLPVLKDVRERGDRYAESILVNVTYRHHLLCDRVDAAREEVARGLGSWYRGGTTVQDFYEHAAQVRIALYTGEGSRAWEICDKSHRAIMRSPLGRMQIIRAEMQQLRGQAAALRASQETSAERRTRWLDLAAGEARAIEREDAAWCRPLALLLRAAVAFQRGHREEALARLSSAERAASDAGMEGFARAAAWQRARITGSAPDDGWLREQRIVSPARFAGLLAPGFDARAAQ